MEPAATGPKMKMTALKASQKPQRMFSGYTMTLNTHGVREGPKDDRPEETKVKEREKAKAEQVEDISSLEDPKAEEKAEEKEDLTW